MQQAIGFAIEKAPKGGYKLSRITGFTEDGKAKIEVVAYCSMLHEAQTIEHQEKQDLFGERAWYPPQVQSQPQPQQQFVPASAVFPSQPPMNGPDHPDEGMPRFMDANTPNGGLMNELRNRFEGTARVLVPLLFVAAMWLGSARLVA